MLTIKDCLDFCELTEEEILAIAEHENLPEVVAVELGNALAQTAAGEQRVEEMIVEDIAAAQRAGNLRHAATLKVVLQRFIEKHPRAD
jgi:uncharacterized hydantoinase/oxoprolinase family protein